jgi:glycosyltransferase involved in cell wall biosynthesis
MKSAPEAKAIIAGNDEENLTPKLRAQAERNGVIERIEFRGPVSGTEKEILLRTSTALVLPSHSENFGNVVLEAMAMSMPVIVTPDVGLASDVERSGSGLVTSNAPDELAAAIRTMLGDPSRRAEMGARGRQLVEERFTWGGVAAQMEEQYARISAAARAGRG